MSYIDELLQQRSDPVGSLAASLRERKAQALNQKLLDKTASMDPEKLIHDDLLSSYNKSANEFGTGDSLTNFAKSSGYSALGNLGDAGKSISNAVFGSDFDNSKESGWSNPANADASAGLSALARDKFNQDTQKVYKDIADGNILSAISGSVALGPRVLADSAATIPEALAGAALTATGVGAGAGLTLLGNKGRKAAKAINGVKEGIASAKKNSTSARLLANSLRSASNTSIMTADMVQQQVHEYKQENGGESPSGPRVAAMVLGNTVANMLQVDILKKLYIPIGGKLNPSLKKFKAEASNLVKYAEEGTAKSLIKTVASGVPAVLKAAGAEGAQEYVQSWVEILSVKMKPDEAGGLLASAYKEITNEDNRNKAVLGMMLGGAAGGTAKTAIGAPGVAIKATADVTKGTTKAVGRVLQNAGDKAALSLMSEEDINNIKTDYKAKKAVAEEAISNLTSKIKYTDNAKSLSELKSDAEISPFVQAYQESQGVTDEDIEADPKLLKDIKNEIVRTHKADRVKIHTELKATPLANSIKIIKDNAIKGTKDKVKAVVETIKESDPDTVIGTVKGLSNSAINTIKSIKSSTALGIIEKASDASTDATKSIIKAAKGLSLTDIEKTAAVVKENNPKAAKALSDLYIKTKKAKERFGLVSDDVVDSTTLPPVVVDVANSSKVTQEQASSTVVNLTKAVTGKINDIKALNTIKKAVSVYENSDITKNIESLARIKKRIQHAERKLEGKTLASDAKDTVQGIIRSLEKESLSDKFKGTTIGTKLQELINTDTSKDAIEKSKSILKDLKSIDTDKVIDDFSSSLQKIVDTNVKSRKDSKPVKTEKAKGDVKSHSNAETLAIAGAVSFTKKIVGKAEDGNKDSTFEDAVSRIKKELPNPSISILDAFTKGFGTLTDTQIDVINKHYPPSNDDSNVQTNEEFDNIPTKGLAESEIESLYVEAHPGCKPK